MTSKHQLAIDLVEVFEDFLEKYRIIIPDPDRPEDNDVPIYGCTWADLVDDIENKIVQGLSELPIVAKETILYVLNSEILNFSIEQFLEKFNAEYQFLYDNHDNVAGYKEAVDEGRVFMINHPSFVFEFVRYRGDALSSDREIAAFMFALSSMSE